MESDAAGWAAAGAGGLNFICARYVRRKLPNCVYCNGLTVFNYRIAVNFTA